MIETMDSSTYLPDDALEQFDAAVAERSRSIGSDVDGSNYDNIERGAFEYDGPFSEGEPVARAESS